MGAKTRPPIQSVGEMTMNTWLITLIALVLLVATILVRRRGGTGDTCTEQSNADSWKEEEAKSLERVIASYEIKFVGAALTKMMSDRNVPFETRHEVWKRYPREYSDPVVGVSTISEEMQISVQRVYSLLADWFSRNNVPVNDINLDGERLRSFLHEKALVSAPVILEDVQGSLKG